MQKRLMNTSYTIYSSTIPLLLCCHIVIIKCTYPISCRSIEMLPMLQSVITNSCFQLSHLSQLFPVISLIPVVSSYLTYPSCFQLSHLSQLFPVITLIPVVSSYHTYPSCFQLSHLSQLFPVISLIPVVSSYHTYPSYFQFVDLLFYLHLSHLLFRSLTHYSCFHLFQFSLLLPLLTT